MAVPLPLASGIPVHCAHHEIVSIHELKPHPSNPNTHPERQLALYAAAIRQAGWREAITVSRRSGFIVSGHGALEAARRIPADTAPVEYQDYASEQEELADLLAHNRLASLSQMDGALLKSVLLSLGGAGASLVTGYSAEAVAELLAEVAPAPQYPIDDDLEYLARCSTTPDEAPLRKIGNRAVAEAVIQQTCDLACDAGVFYFGISASRRKSPRSCSHASRSCDGLLPKKNLRRENRWGGGGNVRISEHTGGEEQR